MPQKVIYNSVLHKTLRTKYTSKLKITAQRQQRNPETPDSMGD